MKRFVVIAQFGEGAQARTVTTSIKKARAAWWHYIENAWLVIDREDRPHRWWHSRLKVLVGVGGRLLIVNVGSGAFSARGPSRMFDWLRSSWKYEASEDDGS